jgi:hypothetical protein
MISRTRNLSIAPRRRGTRRPPGPDFKTSMAVIELECCGPSQPWNAMRAPSAAGSEIRPYHRQIRNPRSAIRNPRSAIRDPRSAIRDPQSAIRNPQSAIRNSSTPGRQLAGISKRGNMEQKDMICRSERQTSLILREDKLGEREFRVDKLKHLSADLVHRDIEHLADSF